MSLTDFQLAVAGIEANSWWTETFTRNRLRPHPFTISFESGRTSITPVPKEPFESLLLPVRKITMAESAANLHRVRKELSRKANESDRRMLDAWRKYWRLAFIKEPFLLDSSGKQEVFTGYKVYDCFINGKYFHSNNSDYNLILYGTEQPMVGLDPNLFLQLHLYQTVTNLCFAALGLDRVIRNNCSFVGIATDIGMETVFDFVLQRNRIVELDEQYRVFSDWIDANGGCKHCRWE